MSTKKSHAEFVFIIPTLSNSRGLKNVIAKIKQIYDDVPIVIANNSQKEINEKAVVLNFEKNYGFARACNLAAYKARELYKPTYLIFLNDDVDFDSNWIAPCIKKLKKTRWIATTPVLIKTNGSVENCGYRVLPYGRIELFLDKTPSSVLDGLTAAALVFDTKIFFKLSGFDERFFAYLEDVDLFLRAKRKGYKFGVTNEVAVTHEGQVTSNKFGYKKAVLDFRNWILVILKNWSFRDLILNLPSILMERIRNLSGIIKAINGSRL
jgi:hypothetical protein